MDDRDRFDSMADKEESRERRPVKRSKSMSSQSTIKRSKLTSSFARHGENRPTREPNQNVKKGNHISGKKNYYAKKSRPPRQNERVRKFNPVKNSDKEMKIRSSQCDKFSDESKDSDEDIADNEENGKDNIKDKGNNDEDTDNEMSDDTDHENDEEDNYDEKTVDTDNEDDEEDNDSEKNDDSVEEEDSDKLLKRYIFWHAMTAGGKSLKNYPAEKESKSELDSALHVLMRICDSRAWDSDFRNALQRYPKYNYRNRTQWEYFMGKQHSRNTGPPETGNCQACIHPWRVKLTLDGEPYYKRTYKERNNDNGTPDVHYIGTGCRIRSKLYHEILHFGHALFYKCMELIDIMGEKGIEEVLFEEMSQKLNRLTRRAKRYRSKKQKASIFDDWSSFWKAVSDI